MSKKSTPKNINSTSKPTEAISKADIGEVKGSVPKGETPLSPPPKKKS
jgi:hypothetical protein